MRPLTSTLVFLALSACGSKWEAADLDGDGYTVAQGDCFENTESTGSIASADIHPGATETWYDGFDQDCSGGSDFDKDGDGHASVDAPDPTGELPSDDCWDDPDTVPDAFSADDPSEQLDASLVFPGAAETWYDGIDQDCGGDDDFDQDGDGFASATYGEGEDCFDSADDEFTNDGGLDPGDVNPDAEDAWYDGTDANCAGNDDFDQDGDGWAREAECDDTDPARFPNDDPEVWYDGVDANCDGNDGDQDGDGFYAADYAFEVPPDYASGDCWDDPAEGLLWTPLNGFDPLAPADVYPAATETWYDGLDQDCGGDGDFDQDGDGFETDAYADAGGLLGDDCDDASIVVFPGAEEEWYNGIDEDCAGDDDFDQDGDSFTNDQDCDDVDADVNPAALETCGNSVDEDCSGSDNDPDAIDCTAFFADADGDTYGGDEVCICRAEGLYTATSGDDCDDGDASVNPAGTESCDTTADDDCDGSTNAVGAPGCDAWYVDGDDDGYGGTGSQCQCEASGAYTADNDDDCNDAVATVSPGAAEACNSVDDDCDGSTDEGLPLSYTDADGDDYGTGTGSCAIVGADNDDDCDDTLANVYPGAPEICDGEPNDCATVGTWTADSEDQLASYVSTAGVWEDISGDFGSTATNYQLEPSGTYYFCGGTFYTKFVGSDDSVDIIGVYGADETIIDNNIAGATVTVAGGSVTISGLTITGGLGSGATGSTYGGGLIASAGSMPATPTATLEDCIVSVNDAAYGGGVAAYTYSWVKLVRTEVSGNDATINGGGVWVSTTGKLTTEDSEITGNTAGTSGGGVYAAGNGTLTLSGTDVHANEADTDGGGIYADDGVLTLTTSFVYDNVAADDAGGIFLDTGTATCTSGGVYGNSASDHGGGVYLSNHSTTAASFTSASCDFGTGATDNSPSDVTIKTAAAESEASYTNYTSYSATATFTCLASTDLCTP